MSPTPPACVSVLLPAYNAEDYVLQSVQSVLAQTFEDFELLVVDDCSTDRTAELLASISDRRLKVLRNKENLGIVGSLNVAMAHAQGRYIARADADDFCLPTRFAKQKHYLDHNPDVLLLGARMNNIQNGRIRPNVQQADPDPAVLRWQFLVSNPIAHPSMMFRAEVVAAMGAYLKEDYKYAEDFDFSHRVMALGNIAVLPERLVIYRLHQTNLTRMHRAEMMAKTAATLRTAYERLLGGDRRAEAAMVAEHVVAGVPMQDPAMLDELHALLRQLVAAFLAAHHLNDPQVRRVVAHAGSMWWGAVQRTLRAGAVAPAALIRDRSRFEGEGRPPIHQLGRAAVAGLVDRRHWLSEWLDAGATAKSRPVPGGAVELEGSRFEPASIRADDPPSLYVVVDTEAEFDWSGPFDRNLTAVSAMAAQGRAQAIFEQFGLRPIYVIDYAVASQPEGYEPLRAILARHACVVGAHLHPWINPPFEESVSSRNSFAGNLPAPLEVRKLRALVEAIQRNFRISPLFFKAGRYGLGPRTMETLAELGFAVDFSILPKADMRHKGGVDFRHADARPYDAAGGRILSVPMTRAHLGLLAPVQPRLQGVMQAWPVARMRLPGLMARLGLANTVTLTPEGVEITEQIQLVRSLIQRGYRTFVLHYHSPSLSPGHTPYVRTDADLTAFLGNIEAVCRSFFEDLGGMPGNPADLLPQGMRERVWPPPACAA